MPADAAIPDGLMKPAEAAALLGLHVNTIYRWIAQDKIPSWVIGFRLRVRRADVARLVERRPRKRAQEVASRREQERMRKWAYEVLAKNGCV